VGILGGATTSGVVGMVNPQIMKGQCMKEVNIGIPNSFEPQKKVKTRTYRLVAFIPSGVTYHRLPVPKLDLGDMRPQILFLTIHVTPRKKKKIFPIEIL